MKKLIAMSLVAMVCVGAAHGFMIAIPFWLDTGSADGSYPPTTGTVTYIGMRNGSTNDLDILLEFFDAAGANVTPTNNTFVLTAGRGTGIRPGATDIVTEGDTPQARINSTASFPVGAAAIYWGGPSVPTATIEDIKSRVIAVSTAGSGESYESAYLAPAAAVFGG